MSQPKILADAISTPLKRAGFSKKSDTWYRRYDELIQLVNLQKSSYGNQYYINIAIWLSALGDDEYPKEHRCPIRFRWESVIPRDEKELERYLNLDDASVTDQTRVAEIGRLMQEFVLPFFESTCSISRLRAVAQTSSWLTNSMYRSAKELLL